MTIPNTQSRVFYSYQIKVGNKVIGTIQSFGPSESRTLERVREINSDQGTRVLEIVPGVVDFQVSADKILLYKENMLEAFGYNVSSIEDIVDDFDIEEICHHPDGRKEITVYKKCHFNSYNRTISVRDTLITESATIWVSWVEKRFE